MRSLIVLLPLVLSITTAPPLGAAELKVVEDKKAITITRDGMLVLRYHKAEVDPPKGADKAYRRSGFIHPLCAPSGEPVTGIHPTDHIHHIGLWHAWVKTKHGADEPDFWNLKKKTGRVRYAKTVAILKPNTEDPAAGFVVEQEHVAYKGSEADELVVLREFLEVKVEYEGGQNVVSYHLEQENVSKESLILPAYRYGGCFAYRAPHHWDKTNSDYLTSEGLDRTNSHATRAKWVAMHGPTEKGDATLVVLISPKNRDFPQRLRTWPPRTNNGAIFLNVVPIQEKPWKIKPGEKIKMFYLLVVSNGKADKEKIEEMWKIYAGEPGGK
jgi:hypothetical protein